MAVTWHVSDERGLGKNWKYFVEREANSQGLGKAYDITRIDTEYDGIHHAWRVLSKKLFSKKSFNLRTSVWLQTGEESNYTLPGKVYYD